MLLATVALETGSSQPAQVGQVIELNVTPKEAPKPRPPESLKELGIAYSIVDSVDPTCDAVLDRVLGSAYETHFGLVQPMSLRQLRDQMGIAFRITCSGTAGSNATGQANVGTAPSEYKHS